MLNSRRKPEICLSSCIGEFAEVLTHQLAWWIIYNSVLEKHYQWIHSWHEKVSDFNEEQTYSPFPFVQTREEHRGMAFNGIKIFMDKPIIEVYK